MMFILTIMPFRKHRALTFPNTVVLKQCDIHIRCSITPTQRVLFADIIVYRNEVIAGDVQSTALDGVYGRLEYPKTDTLQTEMTGYHCNERNLS